MPPNWTGSDLDTMFGGVRFTQIESDKPPILTADHSKNTVYAGSNQYSIPAGVAVAALRPRCETRVGPHFWTG